MEAPDDDLADLDIAIAALQRIRDRRTGGRQSAPPDTLCPVLLDMSCYAPEDLLAAWEAAKIARVHVNTIRNWVETEGIGWVGSKGKYRRFTVCKPLLFDLIARQNVQRKL